VGYLHINNLYKDQRILAFRECFALEKVHGTSAHVSWDGSSLKFFSGGAKYENFVALFDQDNLVDKFTDIGSNDITVYGEAYGGKMQAMSKVYGPDLRFIVFDVKIGETWLAVPNAHDVANRLGLEFVPYETVSTDLADLDRERDRDSRVAERRGILGAKPEGIVIRPLFECQIGGARVIAKYVRQEFRETRSQRQVKPDQQQVLSQAQDVALEWVTPMRLEHVLQKIKEPHDMTKIPLVITAMIEDVQREAAGEIVESKEARKAIGGRAAALYKARIQEQAFANVA
jgi:hypothetical protein